MLALKRAEEKEKAKVEAKLKEEAEAKEKAEAYKKLVEDRQIEPQESESGPNCHEESHQLETDRSWQDPTAHARVEED
jgi:hypothetical protein